jgi:protein-export membrane protein SecD
MANAAPKDSGKTLRARMMLTLGVLVAGLVLLFPQVINRVITATNSATNLGIPTMSEEGFKLGLDLQGGAHLIYEADMSSIPEAEHGEALEGVKDIIDRRVNGLGVSEPIIQTAQVGKSQRVIVELPGVQDVNEAINMIGETPILSFKEPNNEPQRSLTAEEQTEIDAYNAQVLVRAEEIKAALVDGLAFEDAVAEHSEDNDQILAAQGSLGFIGERSFIDPAIIEWAEQAQDGDISDPIDTTGGVQILKRGAEREGGEVVDASHILLCSAEIATCADTETYPTQADALAKAQELLAQANAQNFAALAEEFSMDPGSASQGGDLGTFGTGEMVAPFEEAVMNAEVGAIVGPVETDFGYHLIFKRDARTVQEYELARIFLDKQDAFDILGPQELWSDTGLGGKQLERAEVVTDPQTNDVLVSLQFDSEGRQLFKELTEKHLGSQIAIFLDDTLLSAPTVQAVIADGQSVISGGFTFVTARDLARNLNAGALPVPVELIGQQSIGASLGAESLDKSLYAGTVALVLVMIFMVLYYRLPGFVSTIALSVYLIATMALFKLMGVTLTLAGIAGCILSIGMAVDANVLIFERLKEELQKGKTLKVATEEGFDRAWNAIRDGNLSTVITCLLLIWFGTSFVQGFALTLMLGVLVSMFSAIFVTRTILLLIVPFFGNKANALFLGAKKRK